MLLLYHSPDLVPQSQCNPHMSGMSMVLSEGNYRPSDTPFYLTHTVQSTLSLYLFFSASCFRRTSFLLLEGDPTSWLLTCWGADFSGFSPSSITSIISLFLCTNSSNRGYLRHHLFGTSTGRLPLFLHFSEKQKSLL